MTTSARQQLLQTINEHELQAIVRRTVGNDKAVMIDWQLQELYGAGFGSRIYRVAGEARDQERLLPWSFVLKVFEFPSHKEGQAVSADPGAWNYWKRECQAYQAPWLQMSSEQIVMPRCLGVGECPDIAAWVALEDLSHLAGQAWSLEHFGMVARHVGAFNGAYLVGRPLPDEPWLSHNWLREWTERAQPMITLLPAVADHALVQQVFSASMITALTELWNERDALLSALDRLPQTLCHRDIFPRNVFVQQTAQATQSIVIDWAFAGVGAVGEEVAALVGASLAFFEVEPVKGEELEQRCMSGYLAGLRSVGWDGDEADVRFGYLASYVLRYAIGTLTPVLTVLLDNSKHTWAEQVMRRPIGEIVANTRATVDFQEQRIAEARLILGSRQTCRSQSL